MMLRVLAIRFVRHPGIDINDPKYSFASQIKNYCGVCWHIFFNKRAWKKLNEEYQAQLFRFLKDNKKEAKKVLWLAKGLVEHDDDLDDKYIDYYYEALAQFDITDMQGYYLNKKKFLEILYKEKIEGYQFADQGDFIDMLKSMDENDISEFTPKQLQKIGKYVEMCCVGGTFKAQNFATTHSIWSENLDYAKGFAIEGMSNDKGQLYVAKRHMEYVLPVLYHTKEENLPDIIKAVEELPVYETMSERMICSNIRLQVRKYFDEESEAYKNLIAVVNKYCKA